MANPQNPGGSSNRGFAAMDPAKQRQIASMGGKAAHLKGAAHEFTPAEAREAGRKGGLNSHGRKNANAANAANTANSQSTPQTQPAAAQPAHQHAQPQMTQQSEPRQQQQDEQRYPHSVTPSTPQQS